MGMQPVQLPTSGKSIVVRSEEAHISNEKEIVAVQPLADDNQKQMTVQLVEENNIVRAIDVICSCGKRIRLRCVYDDK